MLRGVSADSAELARILRTDASPGRCAARIANHYDAVASGVVVIKQTFTAHGMQRLPFIVTSTTDVEASSSKTCLKHVPTTLCNTTNAELKSSIVEMVAERFGSD